LKGLYAKHSNSIFSLFLFAGPHVGKGQTVGGIVPCGRQETKEITSGSLLDMK